MQATDYFDRPEISASDIKRLVVSYEHYLIKTEKTPAMDFGTLVHTLILEPEKIDTMFSFEELKLTTKAGRERRDEIEASGLIHLKKQDLETAKKMAEGLSKNPKWESKGEAEKEIYWNYEGQACRSKIDLITDTAICDIKTINDLSRAEQRVKYDYHIQAAFYKLAVKHETGKDLPFRFFFIEKQAPYQCQCIEVDYDDEGFNSVLARGLYDIKKGIENYNKGLFGENTFEYYRRVG